VRSLLLSMRVLSMLGIMIAAACGDSSEQSQMDGFIEYQGPSFVMQVPSNWAQSSNEQQLSKRWQLLLVDTRSRTIPTMPFWRKQPLN